MCNYNNRCHPALSVVFGTGRVASMWFSALLAGKAPKNALISCFYYQFTLRYSNVISYI